MDSDRAIGRIIKVSTYRALVELKDDTTSYVRSNDGGLYSIAQINSFVIIPIGSERVVAAVTGLDMAEEPQAEFSGRHLLVLPISKRTMWVTMVGTITQRPGEQVKRFDYGIRRYPELANPVWFACEEDLDVIFEKNCCDAERAQRMIAIGHSPLFAGYDVRIDMDAFYGKHAAVLGNTGSGKSCTVVAIMKATIEAPQGNGMPHAHFVVFDANYEYEDAFTARNPQGEISKLLFDRLVIRNDGDIPTGLWVPHWFMNGRDITAFFRPGEGAQGPLLHRAIAAARAPAQTKALGLELIDTIRTSVGHIDSMIHNPPTGNQAGFGLKNVRDQIGALAAVLGRKRSELDAKGLSASADAYVTVVAEMGTVTQGGDFSQITADTVDRLAPLLVRAREQIEQDSLDLSQDQSQPIGIDSPVYFDFEHFLTEIFPAELTKECQRNPNTRGYVGTLLMRLEQVRHDPRYGFLFKVVRFEDALASFLRLLCGVYPSLSHSADGTGPPWRAAYEAQFTDGTKRLHQVTILDLSQLASDVLENVTALIARLLLEFMQRCPRRGKYPIVLVLEEAHRYIPAHATSERQQRAREVFERIAKEGRKFGVSLLLASQRPSELSSTVLAQCNSFVIHRIQNPEDKHFFREVLSGVNDELLNQLSVLPQQTALVVGDCVTIPLQVRINDVAPKPRSHDPQFFAAWSDAATEMPDFEEICKKWECR